MSNQHKLTALLNELQHARSPLAQARVLARAWRTVRELSPTDRRLLAHNAGFEGAEEILEGLNRREGGLAPAMLMQVLANARTTDGSAVSDLLAAIRDPQRRGEAISLGVDLANDLLAEPDSEDDSEEVSDALEELQAVEESIIETPEEALAALNSLETDRAEEDPAPESASAAEELQSTEPPPDAELETDPFPPAPPPKPPVVDWSRWQSDTESRRPGPVPHHEEGPSVADVGSRRFEARAVMGAMGAERSVFSQLRVLRRELAGFTGSSIDTLHELIEAFPDGWARRRVLCALLEAGIPDETRDALELVTCLDREFDRRWCLGLLARRGELRGAALTRALDLLDSEFAKRRLAASAG
jgi:hypothetical protein